MTPIDRTPTKGKFPGANKERFMADYLAPTQPVADKLGIPVRNLLGLVAMESGWGGQNKDAKFTIYGHNYFGQVSGDFGVDTRTGKPDPDYPGNVARTAGKLP